MNACKPVARNCKHPERIAVAQIGFGREGKLVQILMRAQIARLHPGRFEAAAVVRHIVVCVLQRPSETLELQRSELVRTRGFDRFHQQAIAPSTWVASAKSARSAPAGASNARPTGSSPRT